MISYKISFIYFFEMIFSFNYADVLSHDVLHADEIICENSIADTVFIDTIIAWRENQKLNDIIALYVSYLRDSSKKNEVGSEIQIQTELIDNQMNGVCYFYLPANHLLIAEATYKRNKLHGSVLIFDNDNIVSHHIYKHGRHIGKCDSNGKLLKLKRHHYYYPKKKCFCKDAFGNESNTKQ